MKKTIITIIISFIILALILSSIVVFANNENQEVTLEEKVTQEIDYLDQHLISILADFNVKDDEQKYIIKWDDIKIKIERLYQIWNTISLDLHSINIENSFILAFSDYLNSSTQNINKKNKTKSMENINKLYQLLPKYSEGYMPSSKETNMLKIKGNIVNAYCLISEEKWQEAKIELSSASKQFTNLLNSVTQNVNNQTTVNQCYIIVNELNKSINLKDKDIFLIEYKNLMEKMEMI